MSTSAVPSSAPIQFNEQERLPLERRFRYTLGYLAVVMAVPLLLTAYLLSQGSPQPLLLIAIACGTVGSATAAFVSALERHAQGLEDRMGGATPDPTAKKERFSERMFYWFLARPWLGAVVGAAVFWGLSGGDLGTDATTARPLSGPRVAFYGLLSGLFAKSVLDILRNLPKNLFRQ